MTDRQPYLVHGSVRSRALRVLWTLEELGQPYELRQVAPRSPEALAVNPTGKIPALSDGDEVLTDSVAIMTFLADRHGGLTHPAGTHARARQDAVTNMVIDEMDAVLWSAAKHAFVLPEAERVPEAKAGLRAEFARSERMLEGVLERSGGPWLTGGDFLICDVLAAHCLGWAGSAKFEVTRDALADYLRRARARAAFGRAMRA